MAKILAYRSAQRLADEMNSRAPSLLQASFDRSMEKWKLLDVTNWEDVDYDETSYEYTPGQREMTYSDASPMTCESNPSLPGTNDVTGIKGFCTKWELGAQLCGLSCGDENIDAMLTKKLDANTMGFGKLYYEQFFFGAEILGYYGIVNHPSTYIGPVTNQAGDQLDLCDLTPNQLVDLLIADTYGMEQPRIVLGLDCYRKVFHKNIGCGNDGNCKTMIQCVREVIEGMPDVNFDINSIMSTELLDGGGVVKASNINHPLTTYVNQAGDTVDISDDSLMIIYDAAVTKLSASRPVWIDAVPTGNAKQAKGISTVNSCGFIVEQTKSVCVRHINCCPNTSIGGK